RARAHAINAHVEPTGYLDIGGPPTFGDPNYFQAVPPKGQALLTQFEAQFGGTRLPVSQSARRAATGKGSPFFGETHDTHGVEWRVLTIPPPGPGYALQIARPPTDVNPTLHR